MKTKILIISQDQSVRCRLYAILNDRSTEIYFAESVSDAELYLLKWQYYLIIIDALDAVVFYTGIEMLLKKPVSAEECSAQAHALLQYQTRQNTDTPIENDATKTVENKLVIDPQYHYASIDGRQLMLTRKEFDLLLYMAKNPGQVFSPEQLYKHVWEDEPVQGASATVKAHIATLRKKLGETSKCYIQNVWGVGYRFMPQDK